MSRALRFGIPFVLVVLILLGSHAWRSAQTAIDPEPTQPSAALTTKRVPSSPYLWWEAENPRATNFPRRNPFAPATAAEAAVLSGNAWIGVEGVRSQPLFLEYRVTVPDAKNYFFYTRKFWQHGPFRWRWDDRPWQSVGSSTYLMDSVGLRSGIGANWISLNRVELEAGPHTLRIELTKNDGAAAFDCFALTTDPMQPRGKLKPDQRYSANIPGWFVFDPEADSFGNSPIDLRFLNEAVAGEHGWIRVKGEDFVQEKTGRPVRFWAVNVGREAIDMDAASMQYMAKFLAKRGVNLVRLHTKLWSEDRRIEPETIDRLRTLIATLKAEGIYTGLSIYFPLWLQLTPESGFPGYSGQHPFSLLFFNREFQQMYYGWWRSLLTTPNPRTGLALRDDPAVAMVELVNEDSYFFWTFDPYKSVPAPQMELLERQFGAWLTQKYGSVSTALKRWSAPQAGDPTADRAQVLPLSEMVSNPNSHRAQDTAAFLMESQQQFFREAIATLRQEMGYRGMIAASNWVTADDRTLGPLDKYANTAADFMDRHGYFDPPHVGDRATYSLNRGDTYEDRSALRFGKDSSRNFNAPIVDVRYNNLPSTISEINWTMPNRFRTEFPLLAAAYGSLQGSDGFVFFATGQHSWEPSLGKFSIASPAILGQFPAMALLYRKGLLEPGSDVVNATLNLDDLKALRGAPIAAPQNLDALRAKDMIKRVFQSPDTTIDPIAFLVGKVNLRFSNQSSLQQTDLSSFIDRRAKTVRSSTGQLHWNYDTGILRVNAPQVQAVSGFLKQAGTQTLTDVTVASDLDYGTIALVALDDRPIAESHRLLLQVMSEEQNFGWRTSGLPRKTIESAGSPPIVVRSLSGTVTLGRPDAASLTVTALDANGYAAAPVAKAATIKLLPDTLYYLIEKR